MASLRIEELTYSIARGAFASDVSVPVIETIGTDNKTATPTGTSAVVWGPAPKRTSLFLRAFGQSYYVNKGIGTEEEPLVASAAHGTFIENGNECEIELQKGESLVAITASIA